MFWRIKRYFREKNENKVQRELCAKLGHQWQTVIDDPQTVPPGNSGGAFNMMKPYNAKRKTPVTECKRCGQKAGRNFIFFRWF